MLRTIWSLVNSRTVRWLSGALVALLGIYGTFFYERKPGILFEVVASASVLDVRESLSKLSIIYDGKDLKAKNQHLHLITVRVTNTGSVDILKTYFDEVDPLGFRVTSGRILEQPTLIGDEYLRNSLRAMQKDNHTVTFAPVCNTECG